MPDLLEEAKRACEALANYERLVIAKNAVYGTKPDGSEFALAFEFADPAELVRALVFTIPRSHAELVERVEQAERALEEIIAVHEGWTVDPEGEGG